MIIIGCDYHPGFQQIAFVDTDSGEWNERRLGHREEAEQFYRPDGNTLGIETFPSLRSPTSGDVVFRSNAIPFDPADSARER